MALPPAIEIARQATLRPIEEIAAADGDPPSLLEHYGANVAKINLEAVDDPGGPAEGPLRRRDGDHADTARRGEDHDDDRSRTGAGLPGQAGDDRHPSGVDGTDLRHQRGRRRRRLQPGRPLREPQSASDGRSPRRDCGQQSSGRHGRQPPPAGQRARPRSPRHHLEKGARCQRPLAAQHRDGPREPRGRDARGRQASTSPRRQRSWRCWRWPRRCRTCGRVSGGSSSGSRRRASRSPPKQLKAAGR